MKTTSAWKFSRSAICAGFFLFLGLLWSPAQARNEVSYKTYTPQEQERIIDSIVPLRHFQFHPATLHGQVNGKYSIYRYENSDDTRVWLMYNMGGPLLVDPERFELEKIDKVNGVWRVKLRLEEQVNGPFELQFLIESKTGRAMVEMRDRDGNKDLFEGTVYPMHRTLVFKNARQTRRCMESQQLLDSLVPRLHFTLRYPQGQQRIDSFYLTTNFITVICCEKVADTWYLRLERPPGRDPYQRIVVEDIAINVYSGETYRRTAYYNYLMASWRHYPWTAVYAVKN